MNGLEIFISLLIILILIDQLRKYNKNKCETFNTNDYNKIYKSKDGYYMTIKKGETVDNNQFKFLLMHNNYNMFKKMIDAYNKGDTALETIELHKFQLQIPGWETSMFLQSIYGQSNGSKTIWKPIIPNKNTGSDSTIQTDEINNSVVLNFNVNDKSIEFLTKKFDAQFVRL